MNLSEAKQIVLENEAIPNREVIQESGVCLYSGYEGLEEAQSIFSEAATDANGAPLNCLKVKLPVGWIDKATANGNVYEKAEMERALAAAKPFMEQGLVHGAHGQHPEGRAELKPTEISHLVSDAWIGEDGLLWNEWTILPTEGKEGGLNLQRLFLGGASIGASIRGTAIREEGKFMRNYNYMGTDTVATPSTGLRPGINHEHLRATIQVESYSQVKTICEGVLEMSKAKENKTKAEILAEELSTVAESLRGAASGSGERSTADLITLGQQLGALEGRVTELQRESDGKDESIKSLESKVRDLTEIQEALSREKNEAVQSSKTFLEAVEDLKKQVEGLKTKLESGEEDESKITSLEEQLETKSHALKEATGALDELRGKDKFKERYEAAEAALKKVQEHLAEVETVATDVRNYSNVAEIGLDEMRNKLISTEEALEEVRDLSVAQGVLLDESRAFSGFMENSIIADLTDYAATLEQAVIGLKDRLVKAESDEKPIVGEENADRAAYVRYVEGKYPQLKAFREELLEASSMKAVNERVRKYLDLFAKDESQNLTVESTAQENLKRTREAVGIERYTR